MLNAENLAEAEYINLSLVFDPTLSEFKHVDKSIPGLSQDEAKITPELLLSKIHPEDRDYVKARMQDFINSQLTGSVEFRVEHETETFWVRVTPFIIRKETTTLFAASITDITAEWHNVESIRRYANKKNSILNMLAHDLRGPLDIAQTLTKSISKKTDDPNMLAMSRSITGILNQSIAMIADLIDRELIETVEVELALKRIDIVKKVAEYIAECKRSETAAGRTFEIESTSQSIFIDLDEAKFMQIMNNLTSNALKFTQPGGQIKVDIAEREDSILFTFSDDGIGIPDRFHPILFDKFTAARRKGLSGEPTMGLGLSIVKMIIEWHKGKVWVHSKENEGTSFYFEIPKIALKQSGA